MDGLLRQCASSLGYLIDETDPSITEGILIEVKLELCEPDVIFQPSLDTQIVGNFFDRMSGYIDDILHVCRLLPRVSHYNCSPVSDEKAEKIKLSHKKNDETSKVNYYKVISRHREFKRMTEQVMDRVRSVMNLSNKHKGMYTEYSYLWMESRVEFMHYFLTYGRQLTQEELDQLEEDDKAVKKQYPSLDQFREQIDYYEGLHDQLKSIESTKVFHSWFRVDIRPFKLALVTCVRRWSYAFKKHLTEHVVNSLSELNNFIDRADEGLMTSTEEGDYDGLVKVMEFLRMVNRRQATADVMFEPLRGIINMLRSYGVVIPEESMVQLNELPEKWANTKRLSVQAKQQVSPLQSLEVGKLKNRISDFDKKQVSCLFNFYFLFTFRRILFTFRLILFTLVYRSSSGRASRRCDSTSSSAGGPTSSSPRPTR